MTTHQADQDTVLFPRLAARSPDVGPVLHALRQDHARVARLVHRLRSACAGRQDMSVLRGRLDDLATGLHAHFAHEQRRLQPELGRP